MNLVQRTVAAFKAFTAMQWSRSSSWFSMMLGSTQIDYRASAGDGRTNAAVMACVRFAQRTFPEAPLVVMVRNSDGELKPVPDHALQQKLEHPNPYYSGVHLLGAIVADLMLTGNAYIVKVRTGNRRIAELWWAPSTTMEPAWPDDGSKFISHYEYRVEGDVINISPEDVVHLRQGFDPSNQRKGLSDLVSLYREIATDNEAANWTASLLRNGAVPGIIVSPEGDTVATTEEAEEVREKLAQRWGGDNRGGPTVMKGATKVQVLSFSPQEMDLARIRNVPEERITAVFGIPAAVVGLGTGLEQTKVGATMAESREQAYESCLIPLQRLIVAELQMQLVPDFGDPATLRLMFDLSQVRVLQDDQNALHERARADLGAGLVTLNQALQMIGQEPLTGPEGDARFIPNTVTVVTTETMIPDPAALAEPTPLRALPAATEDDDEDDAAKAGKGRVGDPGPRRRIGSHSVGAARHSGRKSIEDIPRLFDMLREDDEPTWRKAIQEYLTDQLHRVVARMVTGQEVAEALLPILEADILRDVLTPLQRSTLASVRRITVAELGVAFNLPDPVVREYLAECGANIRGVTDHTRDQIRAALIEGQAAGEGIPQLSARLRGLPAFDEARARVVSRTELGLAQNLSARTAYLASGVVTAIRVLDSDADSTCQSWNGRVVPITDAATIPMLGHPNCVRALAPAFVDQEAVA